MFSRTILALSLSACISSISFAENTASNKIVVEQYSLSQQHASAEHTASPASAAIASEQDHSNSTTATSSDASAVDSVPTDSSKVDAASHDIAASSPTQQPSRSAKWTLKDLNQADWSEGLQRGQFPIYAKAQVLLNRKHASPGAIDGSSGKNTLKAISTYQTMQGLAVTGELDQATWESLNTAQSESVFIEYTLTANDLRPDLYAKSISSNYADQAKMKSLSYTRVTEMLGERFHMDESFLKKINPKAKFNQVGEKIIVANARNSLPEDIHLIVAHKGAKQLYLFNSKNKMIASFPATIGSSDTPSPTGTYTVKVVAPNPWYSYNPKNFIQGGNMKPLSLPPGPNNPVGNMWIGLSKPSFGIHGTPNPSLISKTASHGCIRLTNWDANDLAKRVKSGVVVRFLE